MTSQNNNKLDNQNQEVEILDQDFQEQTEEAQEISLEDALKEAEDKYIRSLAEIENTRRRYEKRAQYTAKYAVADFAKETLNVLDIFKKAFEGVKENEIEDSQFLNFLTGIKLTQKELEKIITKFGIEKLGTVGEKFDPNWHEALYAKPDEASENDIICEVIEDGYKIHDRLLRSAKVGIIKN